MSYVNVRSWIRIINHRTIATFNSVCCYFPSSLGAHQNNPLRQPVVVVKEKKGGGGLCHYNPSNKTLKVSLGNHESNISVFVSWLRQKKNCKHNIIFCGNHLNFFFF